MGVFASGVLAGPAKVALVVVAVGGLTAGAYFTYQIGPGGSAGADVPAGATEAASPTATLETVTPTATAEPTIAPPTPSPSATAVPTLPPTPTQPPAPTADTRVPIGDLPTADQFQLGKDGKYFVADRGDGCMWVEYLRDSRPEVGLQVFLRTDCPADFGITFRPESGEVLRLS